MTTTAKNITVAQLFDLRDEALAASDHEMIRTCDRAAGGDDAALKLVARVIADAQAAADVALVDHVASGDHFYFAVDTEGFAGNNRAAFIVTLIEGIGSGGVNDVRALEMYAAAKKGFEAQGFIVKPLRCKVVTRPSVSYRVVGA